MLTQDIDILYRIEDANILRLKAALTELNAVARGDPRCLPLNETRLRTKGHKLAITDAGPLDVLGLVNMNLVYEDLLGFAEEFEVAGLSVLVLSLDQLIQLKRALGRPKDVAMLPTLEATLRARQRG